MALVRINNCEVESIAQKHPGTTFKIVTVVNYQEELLLPDQPDSSSSSDEDVNDGPPGDSECPVEEPDARGNCPL